MAAFRNLPASCARVDLLGGPAFGWEPIGEGTRGNDIRERAVRVRMPDPPWPRLDRVSFGHRVRCSRAPAPGSLGESGVVGELGTSLFRFFVARTSVRRSRSRRWVMIQRYAGAARGQPGRGAGIASLFHNVAGRRASRVGSVIQCGFAICRARVRTPYFVLSFISSPGDLGHWIATRVNCASGMSPLFTHPSLYAYAEDLVRI
jgi:hypothetical protein